MKDTLKAAQQLCRLTKRFATSSTSIDSIWLPAKWESLAKKLSSSKHYASSTSLPPICLAIAKLSQTQSTESADKAAADKSVSKRKIEEDGETKKGLQKKAKKAKGSR